MSPCEEGRPGSPEAARIAFDGAVASLAESPRCLCCRRPLSDPSSVRRGYGPRCFARLHLGQRLAMADLLDALGIGSVIA